MTEDKSVGIAANVDAPIAYCTGHNAAIHLHALLSHSTTALVTTIEDETSQSKDLLKDRLLVNKISIEPYFVTRVETKIRTDNKPFYHNIVNKRKNKKR